MKALLVLCVFSTMLLSPGSSTRAAGDEGAAVIQLENDFCTAWLKLDAKWIEQHEATEMVFTGADGVVTDRAADLASLKSGTTKVETMAADEMRALVFGDSAVVVGRITIKGQYQGKDMSGVFRFTDTWLKRDGRWQVVASQNTRIAK